MDERPVFEEVISSQVEVLQAEKRLRKLESELNENSTEEQLAACGRARDIYESLGGYTLEPLVRSVLFGLGFEGGMDCGSGKAGSGAGSLEAGESFLLLCHRGCDPFFTISEIGRASCRERVSSPV